MEKWIKKDQVIADTHRSITKNELQEALNFSIQQVKKNIQVNGATFPEASSQDLFYHFGDNVDWTTGFWTGEIWLSYENTLDPEKKDLFLKTGKKQMASFYHRIENMIDVEHHDMGFLYSLSCVAGYKLTGDLVGKEAALKAADNLMSRFQEKGQFLQAWGKFGAKENYRLIIDCLLNVPLLYWAAEETKNKNYQVIAEKHIETTMKYIMREDYSTWHTIFFDPETGNFDHGETSQGYKDSSAWARGQAWGIYGSALAYRNTGKKEYIEFFRKVADFYLRHLPADLCPFWDLEFGNGDEKDQPRDSSAAAIAVCGFLEMSKFLPTEEANYYTAVAKKIMATLVDHYQVKDSTESNGQLLHGTYAKKSPYNTVEDSGVDECVIWGDYFFLEGINRLLNPAWELYW